MGLILRRHLCILLKSWIGKQSHRITSSLPFFLPFPLAFLSPLSRSLGVYPLLSSPKILGIQEGCFAVYSCLTFRYFTLLPCPLLSRFPLLPSPLSPLSPLPSPYPSQKTAAPNL